MKIRWTCWHGVLSSNKSSIGKQVNSESSDLKPTQCDASAIAERRKQDFGNSKMRKSAAGAIVAIALAVLSFTKALPPEAVYVDPLMYFQLNLSDTVQMANGGTGPYKGDLLFVTPGCALLPPSIVRVNPNSSYSTTVLLDNFLSRQFNSLNDIKVLPGTDIMFFTDPP
ncbi:uncharacterized protein EDB91DRAFT_1160616 [Suillus paluster]|uniref:uncharacterized protein n=1 Tax=Suillus paluster TaxID=48578 RepID=UPI001B85D3BB|nr:uncharacterized protein EDB91DRAFT_1160616 [Suillus paluster]KAG1728856.1 hypothetical protein EDB91DRAFT_1160616 [Suillus paluster]